MKSITAASFILTERCNLACKYCFENGRRGGPDMTAEVAQKGLEWLFENAVASKAKEVSIILFGGEPFLKPALCDQLLSLGLKFQNQHKITFAPSVITNATIMNDELELMLYRHASRNPRFSCQLSIDGAEQSQNLYRVYPSGKGSYETVAVTVSRYRDIFGGRLNIHGCINKQTMPLLFDNYKFIAEQWKPGSIWFMPVHTEDWDENDVKLYDEQLGKIFSHEAESLNTVSYYAPINKLLSFQVGRECHHDKTCGAGVSFVSITGEGDIYPCHNIYFKDDKHSQKVGNIFDGVLDDEILKPYEEYTYRTMGCGKCENTACYRCIADNWAENGDINKQVGKVMRCKLSSVERKWQNIARDFAIEHYQRPSQLDRMEQNLTQLTKILYNGMGGEADGT